MRENISLIKRIQHVQSKKGEFHPDTIAALSSKSQTANFKKYNSI